VVQSAQLEFAADDLTIVGPGQDQLAITTAHRAGSIILRYPNRIFSHSGRGTLTFQNVSIEAGNVSATTQSISGGCILSTQSTATVKLINATVSGCTATSDAQAGGGAIQAAGTVYLLNSSVIGNRASGTNYGAFGGGIDAASVTLRQSSVVGNTAYGTTGSGSVVSGGGIGAATLDIAASTVSGNQAIGGRLTHYNVQSSTGGGIYAFGGATISISNSTVSGNSAGYKAGAQLRAATVTLTNSTFAFNQSSAAGSGVALAATGSLTFDSTVFSNNVGASLANDLSIGGSVTPVGTHNLVFATTSPMPSGTLIGACPLLAPLADNGGPTQTHALYSHSPALNAGDNSTGLSTDQRGSGFPRVRGAAADIGSFEVNPADDVFGSGFDGC
jgi:hypothetical protein